MEVAPIKRMIPIDVLNQIDIRGNAKVDDVKKPYQMHKDIERELLWRGPMTELPPKLG